MTQSLELLLDPQLDAAVRGQWATLIEAGLPSQGRHRGPSNAPHITLAVADRVPEEVERALGRLAGPLPIDVRLTGLLCFARPNGRQILVRSVVMSAALLELHARAARAYHGLPGIDRLLAPGNWAPHVTLGHGLTPDQVGRAIEILGHDREPTGRAVALRRWDSDTRNAWVLDPPPAT